MFNTFFSFAQYKKYIWFVTVAGTVHRETREGQSSPPPSRSPLYPKSSARPYEMKAEIYILLKALYDRPAGGGDGPGSPAPLRSLGAEGARTYSPPTGKHISFAQSQFVQPTISQKRIIISKVPVCNTFFPSDLSISDLSISN